MAGLAVSPPSIDAVTIIYVLTIDALSIDALTIDALIIDALIIDALTTRRREQGGRALTHGIGRADERGERFQGLSLSLSKKGGQWSKGRPGGGGWCLQTWLWSPVEATLAVVALNEVNSTLALCACAVAAPTRSC